MAITVQELIELTGCKSGNQLAKIVKVHPSGIYTAKKTGVLPRRWLLEAREYVRNKKGDNAQAKRPIKGCVAYNRRQTMLFPVKDGGEYSAVL